MKHLLISSPNNRFILTLKERLESITHFKLGLHSFTQLGVKKFSVDISKYYETATPIVLHKNNDSDTYLSFRRGDDVTTFMTKLKENAIKKYQIFYNLKSFEMKEPLFDAVKIKRSTSVKIRKNKKEFVIIGTQAYFSLFSFRKNKSKFYRFIMECGLGEKNSMGFGFLNPIKIS